MVAARSKPSLEELAALGGEEGGEAQGKVQGLPREELLTPPPLTADETRVKPPKVTPPKEKAAPAPRKRASTASERELQEVGESIEEKIAVIFGLASGLAPVTSVYAVENSDKAISALLQIAKRRPAVLRALTKVADGADALEIAKFVLGLLVCIQVDTGRLQGDELPARAFGVTQIIQANFIDNEGIIPTEANPNIVKEPNHALRFSAI